MIRKNGLVKTGKTLILLPYWLPFNQSLIYYILRRLSIHS
uniref:Uncharacterized protein n=1 Tax=Manihot esculenta TaxID=3983 RepID=A0A2C9UAA5_MANES